MKKFLRIAVAAVVLTSFATLPTFAGTSGTDPHPQFVYLWSFSAAVAAILSALGL
jgi:hypothetical protein